MTLVLSALWHRTVDHHLEVRTTSSHPDDCVPYNENESNGPLLKTCHTISKNQMCDQKTLNR